MKLETWKIDSGCYEVAVNGQSYRIQRGSKYKEWHILLETITKLNPDPSCMSIEWVWHSTFPTKADCLLSLGATRQ